MIEYAYDNLSRLREARYNPGTNVDAADGDLLRRYQYSYDRAGNRRTEEVWVNGSPTADITYDYNAANQLIDDGTHTYEYDGNGNLRYKKLTGTPVEEYTWNRANRLVTWDNGTPANLLNYSYDGLNNRISRSLGTTSPTVTKYLIDQQPGLSVVLAATVDTDVTRYVHGPRGIHAQESPAGAWSWMVQDGLGSVRGVVDNSVAVTEVRLNDPFGNQVIGSSYAYAATVYGFTGELTETVNPLVHLRARDYNPALGVFTALDPFEGKPCTPMSLNRYLYVEGSVPNITDPSGMLPDFDIFGALESIWTNPVSLVSAMNAGMCLAQTTPQDCARELAIRLGRTPSIREIILFCLDSTVSTPTPTPLAWDYCHDQTAQDVASFVGNTFSLVSETNSTYGYGFFATGVPIFGLTYIQDGFVSAVTVNSLGCPVDELITRLRIWQPEDPIPGGTGENPCKSQSESKCNNCAMTPVLRVELEERAPVQIGESFNTMIFGTNYLYVIEHTYRRGNESGVAYTLYDTGAYGANNQNAAAFAGTAVYVRGEPVDLASREDPPQTGESSDACPRRF